MSQQQFQVEVEERNIQQEIERVIQAAQVQPITPADASLLRWAAGVPEKGIDHANS